MMKPFFLVILAFISSCSTIKSVYTEEAPKAIGPYSQAIVAGNTIYCSGQIAINPTTGLLDGDNIEIQTQRALENLKAVLIHSGSDFNHVLKVNLYLKDLNDFTKVNSIYSTYFASSKPARTTVQITALPKNALIEIDCIALKK